MAVAVSIFDGQMILRASSFDRQEEITRESIAFCFKVEQNGVSRCGTKPCECEGSGNRGLCHLLLGPGTSLIGLGAYKTCRGYIMSREGEMI